MLDQVVCCFAFLYTSHYRLLGLATVALGVAGFASSRCDLSVLVKLQAASSIFTQTEDFSTFRQPTYVLYKSSFSTPVTSLFALCLRVDRYLCVPDCTLQKSLDTHSEGLSLC